MKNFIYICVFLLVTMTMLSCATAQSPPPIHFTDVTIIEGKTTKAEILNTFGTPRSFGQYSLFYSYPYKYYPDAFKIRYIQFDGTEFHIIRPIYDVMSSIDFSFNDNGILESANFN